MTTLNNWGPWHANALRFSFHSLCASRPTGKDRKIFRPGCTQSVSEKEDAQNCDSSHSWPAIPINLWYKSKFLIGRSMTWWVTICECVSRWLGPCMSYLPSYSSPASVMASLIFYLFIFYWLAIRLGDEEGRLMHPVPASAVRLMKRRVLSRPGLNSPLAWSITLPRLFPHAQIHWMVHDITNKDKIIGT